jgi:dihydroxyacetone kinase-like protein
VVLDVNWAVKWLTLCAQAMAEHRVELIELDRAIGDSDHGENMDRGFQAVLDKLAEAVPQTPAAALKLTAMTLMSKVGGAAGPLYGTAFLRASAAQAAKAAAETGSPDILTVLVAAAEAAEAGAVATDPLVARKGRASYLGERSAGHRDPGAASSALILRAAVGAAA